MMPPASCETGGTSLGGVRDVSELTIGCFVDLFLVYINFVLIKC